jgi:hypothetical protein
MTHVPQRQERHTDRYQWTQPGENPSGNVDVGERAADKVIYGPKGEVIKRIEDRPFLGYHRDNGT